MPALVEYIQGQIWLCEYPVHYFGLDFNSRMTVIRLDGGSVLLHSPCAIDEPLKQAIEEIGPVTQIVAPGTYHYFHIASAQDAFPQAQTFICPGIEQKLPELEFDGFLGDKPALAWSGDFEQVLVRGNRFIREVAFFHKPSRTLLLVDLVENIGDSTEGVGWGMKFWWKIVFRMWNKAKPAPEYQLGWNNKNAARLSLERILEWEFERVIIAHGDLIEANAKSIVRSAWEPPLEGTH